MLLEFLEAPLSEPLSMFDLFPVRKRWHNIRPASFSYYDSAGANPDIQAPFYHSGANPSPRRDCITQAPVRHSGTTLSLRRQSNTC